MMLSVQSILLFAGIFAIPAFGVGTDGNQLREYGVNSTVSSDVTMATQGSRLVLSWIPICLLLSGTIGLGVMATVGCLYCARGCKSSSSYTLDSQLNLNPEACHEPPGPKEDPVDGAYSPPNPMAVWHGTLDRNLNGPSLQQQQLRAASSLPKLRGDASADLPDEQYEPPPLQYADLLIGPRGYETIPQRSSEKTSYADIKGELRTTLDRQISVKSFVKRSHKS